MPAPQNDPQDQLATLILANARLLEKAKAQLARRAVAQLSSAPALISDDLRASGAFEAVQAGAKVRRLATFSTAARETLRGLYKDAYDDFRGRLLTIAEDQSNALAEAINEAIGEDLATGISESDVLAGIVDDALVQGAPIKEWFARQAGSLWQRSVDAARHSLVNEAGASAVGDAVGGDSMLGVVGSGAINQAKVQMDALVRTAVATVHNDAKLATLEANSDVVEGFVWVSVLDEATTDLCDSLDGLEWDLDYKPIGHDKPFPGNPPLHWNCRSTVIPLLK